jgi:hypothetical protein
MLVATEMHEHPQKAGNALQPVMAVALLHFKSQSAQGRTLSGQVLPTSAAGFQLVTQRFLYSPADHLKRSLNQSGGRIYFVSLSLNNSLINVSKLKEQTRQLEIGPAPLYIVVLI